MGSKTKTKTVRTPYDPAAVHAATGALNNAYGQAQGTIAQWSPALNNAISSINANINTPPAFVTDARANLDKTINGGYLTPDSNPYSSGLAKLIADRTQGEYNATFGGSGRAHGGLAALLSGQGVADALGNFYNGVYNTERGYQQQATMAEPSFNQDLNTAPNELYNLVTGTSMMPLNAANAYGLGITTVNSPYTTDTTTQKQGFGLGQALGLAGMIGSAFIPGAGAALGAAGGLGGGLAGLIAPSMAAFNPVNVTGGGAINNLAGRFLG